jgi:hypothetical protein
MAKSDEFIVTPEDWLAIALWRIGNYASEDPRINLNAVADQLDTTVKQVRRWLKNGIADVPYKTVARIEALGDVDIRLLAKRRARSATWILDCWPSAGAKPIEEVPA